MKRIDELKAAVVGTGFIGAVHVDALRRLGVEVFRRPSRFASDPPERSRPSPARVTSSEWTPP
jgi:hypothetical protein